MPKALKRYYGTGDLHFITCSCYKRRPWLNTGQRRDLFLKCLEEVRQQHRIVVLGYVVMPEHFHLLMCEPQVGDPSTAMQSVKQRFAQRVMPRRRRRNPAQQMQREPQPMPVWQPRFYDFNVWTERKPIEKLRYMHRNPVRRGLVEEPEQWPWSSFRYYQYREVGLARVNDCDLLRMRIKASAA
ncbi:MAG: transposase [Terriglobales bacterium]|jgi:REP-associated tyrosine transposase